MADEKWGIEANTKLSIQGRESRVSLAQVKGDVQKSAGKDRTDVDVRVSNELKSWRGKLSDPERQVLMFLGDMARLANTVLDTRGSERTQALMASIGIQRNWVRMVLANVSDKWDVSERFSELTKIVGEGYERVFKHTSDSQAFREGGLMQGARAFVTSVLLFERLGCEVKFPAVEDDLERDIDLWIRTSEGRVFGVDITGKGKPEDIPGSELSDSFALVTGDERKVAGYDVAGMIRLNVPPAALTGEWAGQSMFYNHGQESVGIPSEEGFTKFKGEAIRLGLVNRK